MQKKEAAGKESTSAVLVIKAVLAILVLKVVLQFFGIFSIIPVVAGLMH